MSKLLNIIFLSLFLVLSTQSCKAQQTPETVKVDGDKYYVHIVKSGQTLYAISKKYAIDVAEIKKANPELDIEGLKIGQSVLIPKDEVDRREFKKSDVSISGDTIFHKVVKKETLYSLSKKYGLGIDQILKINPIVEKEGLETGMTVKIPYKSGKSIETEELEKPREDSLRLHIVQPKETLYSLSKEYDVSIDSIQIINDGLQEGLKVGTTIRIPKSNPKFAEFEKQDSIIQDSLKEVNWVQTKPFEIAVFLPLKLWQADTLDSLGSDVKELMIDNTSKIALNFYRGLKMAVDTLNERGVSANIHVYDTGGEVDTLKSKVENDTLQYDLVIGPMFRSNFEWLVKHYDTLNIPMVSPVPISSKFLLSKDNVVKVHPGSGAQMVRLAQYIGNTHSDSNLVLWNSSRFSDRNLVKIARKHINQCVGQLGHDSVMEMSAYTPSKSRIFTTFKDSTHYTLFVPSKEQAYISQLITSLNDLYLSDKGVTFTIFGLNEWAGYDNLEITSYQNLDIHIPTPRYLEYDSPAFISVLKDYRKLYGVDPDEFALLGYDVSHYFITLLDEYGPYMLSHLEKSNKNGLSVKFNFVKLGAESGYENQAIYIFRYKNYEKDRVH
ncbi:MAG: LysM peptidoglycan-binding domain-containing protein [Salibacter sp.]|uniref:LysM peptidoglycan-binding domain-containing protein n=1 Tax=Salibacter sp. TaxID=2010995 RepID=UPI00287088C5|nr:LysM peptidoglycan-binding domain-containing protein [Salibacter sp.]MDR9399067.1 LysM peptidoglycan-binding domain-containing protein [Salibacter sp.]